MDLGSFRDELGARDGEAAVWLVYREDAITLQGERGPLVLQRAFWTRGQAYAYAERLHRERPWQHLHAFRVTARADAVDVATWDAAFEMAFDRPGAPNAVRVSPTAVAHALGRR